MGNVWAVAKKVTELLLVPPILRGKLNHKDHIFQEVNILHLDFPDIHPQEEAKTGDTLPELLPITTSKMLTEATMTDTAKDLQAKA